MKKYGITDFFSNEDSENSLPLFEGRFCPNCGSNKVEPDQRKTSNLGELLFNLDDWHCRECKYTRLMPTRSDKGEKKLEFEPIKKKINPSAGKGLFTFYIKILIPIMIIAYLLFRLLM